MNTTPDSKPDIHATVNDIKDQAARLADNVKAEGQDVIEQVQERAETLATEHKATGAEQAETISRAMQRAAGELDQGSPMIAGYVRDAAGSVQQLAQSLRDRSPQMLVQDMAGLARRQPAGFFGIAVLAGFAVARFARASAPDAEASRDGLPRGAAQAPGWVQPGADAAPRPATIAAASLGGAAAYHTRHDI